jgi:Fic family protein
MHHIFSVDEYYWGNRPRYYAALAAVRHEGEDLSTWLEYCAEGLRQTLENVWLRLQAFNLKSSQKLILRPRQEQLLKLLRDHGSMAPAEIWKALDISRQGAMDLLHPMIEAGIIEKLGSKKNGRYVLRQP